MSSHLILRALEHPNTARPSYVMWSVKPATTAIFFVHGFGGSAVGTWRMFDSLTPQYGQFEAADLFFLGYRSIRRQTYLSAKNLFVSCDDLIRTPAKYMNPSIYHADRLGRANDHQYSQIVFVAHSLGAVVTRQLLLIAQEKRVAWLDRVRMILFAPAHKGATDVRKLPSALAHFAGPLSAFVGTLVYWKAQTLEEVKEGSTTLKDLEQQTGKALRSRKRLKNSVTHLTATRVIFGDDEDIVRTTPFCEDPSHEPVANRGHVDICKPAEKYRDPLALISA